MGQANSTLRNLTDCFGQFNTNHESITQAGRIDQEIADLSVTTKRLVGI